MFNSSSAPDKIIDSRRHMNEIHASPEFVFHFYVPLSQVYCCIVVNFFLFPSQSLCCLCPSCPVICYLPQTIFSPILISIYSVPAIPHELQHPISSIVFVLCFHRGWLSGRVLLSPGTRLHDMMVHKSKPESNDSFHLPIMIFYTPPVYRLHDIQYQ